MRPQGLTESRLGLRVQGREGTGNWNKGQCGEQAHVWITKLPNHSIYKSNQWENHMHTSDQKQKNIQECLGQANYSFNGVAFSVASIMP